MLLIILAKSLTTKKSNKKRTNKMANFWKALRRAAKATVSTIGPGSFTVEGKIVVCNHCGKNEFTEG
jgi:hypothetical protein